LDQVFAAFDPDPIGSASISCVYHAVLKTGEEVAVKVRRPGIGSLFAADLRIINIFLKSLEFLVIIRPNFTTALREEISAELMQELNFRLEARYQDLWRRKAKRDKQKFISAPRVYHKLCGQDVIVSEFVAGVWIIDLLVAKESNNREALEYFASQGISYKQVAQRLVRARHWASHENTFFHADPHPANIVVQSDNKLVFVDFGACSSTSNMMRRNYTELFRRQANRDVDGMAQVFINMISPLPYLDLDVFSRFVETETWNWLYGFESAHSSWWERTSTSMWIHLFEATRKFRIPVNTRTVRLMRSTILYETIAARLYDKISVEKEYRRYEADAERRILERFYDRITTLRPGNVLLEVGRVIDLTQRLVYMVQRLADSPIATFQAELSKASHAFAHLLRFVLSTAILTGVSLAIARIGLYLKGEPATLEQVFKLVAWSPIYWTILGLFIVRTLRLIQFRLFDIDNPNGERPPNN
jgi:predicted unusual protein kinase regulating ubiquinone biosynthesis (AarF/ABC1/UbiB family)